MDPFKELNEEFLRLRRINLTEYELSADKYLGLDGNECTTKEHLIIYKEILSSLSSKVDDGKNDNNFVEENEVPTIKLLSNRRIRGRKWLHSESCTLQLLAWSGNGQALKYENPSIKL